MLSVHFGNEIQLIAYLFRGSEHIYRILGLQECKGNLYFEKKLGWADSSCRELKFWARAHAHAINEKNKKLVGLPGMSECGSQLSDPPPPPHPHHGTWANQLIHSFLVGCLIPCLQETSVRVGYPQPP